MYCKKTDTNCLFVVVNKKAGVAFLEYVEIVYANQENRNPS